MKNQIDHLGIIVKNLNASIPFYTDILELKVTHTETIESENVKVALIPGGSTKIELIEPLTNDCHAGKYLEKYGEGLHHICYRVPNIIESCKKCREAGIRLLNEEPKQGANGRKFVFLDPRTTNHVLIELCQEAEESIFGDNFTDKTIIEDIKNGFGRIDLKHSPSE